MGGQVTIGVPGYENLPQILLAAPGSMERSRFWFYPVPLATGDLRFSDSGQTLLVNAGLQVLTEEQYVAGKSVTGTGQPSAAGLRAAEEFNAVLDDLEAGDRTALFAQLRGLTDIVTLAVIWRNAGLGLPVLEQLAGLPIRSSGADVTMPEYLPAVSTTLTTASSFATVSGGVDIGVSPGSRSVERVRDRTTAALEAAAANFPAGSVSTQIAMPLVLPRAGTRDAAIGDRGLQAELAASAGDFGRARELFNELTVLDPLGTDNWSGLAYAEAELGRFAEARQAIRRAQGVDPANDELKMFALDIELRANPRFSPAQFDMGVRSRLAQTLAEVAASAVMAGQLQDARILSDRAIAADPQSADAYLIRSRTYGDNALAIRDLRRAVGIYRRQSFEPGADVSNLSLANAALLETQAELISSGTDDGQTKLRKLEEVYLEVRQARSEDPSNAVLAADEVLLMLRLYPLYLEHMGFSNLGDVIGAGQELARQHPDYPMAHMLLGIALDLDGRPAEALSSFERAVALAPTDARALLERSGAHAQLGQCDMARADIERARELGTAQYARLEEVLAKCS